MEFIAGGKKRIQRIGKRLAEELRVVTSGQIACVPIFQHAKMVLLVSLLISSFIPPSCFSLLLPSLSPLIYCQPLQDILCCTEMN